MQLRQYRESQSSENERQYMMEKPTEKGKSDWSDIIDGEEWTDASKEFWDLI